MKPHRVSRTTKFRQAWAGLNKTARRHAFLAVAWLLMVIPTVLWWSESILWVCTMSIYAIVIGHWSAVEAAREDLEK